MEHKKRGAKRQKYYIAAVMAVLIIFATLLILTIKNPSITGNVILGKETVYSDNLNIQKNESGTYEWNVKNPGSIRSIKATGSVTSNGTAKVYIEKNGTRYLLFDSSKQLFDVNVHVLPEYKKIFQGDEVLMQIAMFNLRGFGSGNISVKYSIKDYNENLIASEEETIFVETRANFVRKLIIPQEIKPGTYIASVEAFANVVVGSGTDTFEVNSKTEPRKYAPELKTLLTLLSFAAAFTVLLIWTIHSLLKLKMKKKIVKLKEKTAIGIIDKLETELKSLEKARDSGFISNESYAKEKKRIEEKLASEKNSLATK